MEAPGITRHRKPFLAPIFLSILIALAVVGALAAVLAYASASAASVTVVLRHGEVPGTIEDPPLSEAGELRAQTLARMFGEGTGVGHVTAVFASEQRRTQQAVTPLAARLGLPVTIVRTPDVKQLVARLSARVNAGTAVVAVDSATLPQIVSGLAKVTIPPIADSDYGTMYVVTVPRFGKPSIVSLRY